MAPVPPLLQCTVEADLCGKDRGERDDEDRGHERHAALSLRTRNRRWPQSVHLDQARDLTQILELERHLDRQRAQTCDCSGCGIQRRPLLLPLLLVVHEAHAHRFDVIDELALHGLIRERRIEHGEVLARSLSSSST